MFIQVKSGPDVHASENWQEKIQSIIEGTLSRFDDQITSVNVFVSDENSKEKSGNDDKRCLIEVRLVGMQPIAVRTHAPSFDVAVSECAEKIERAIDHRLGRLEDKDGHTSQSGDSFLGELEGPLPDVENNAG